MKPGKNEANVYNSTNNLKKWIMESGADSTETEPRCLVFRTNIQNKEAVEGVSGKLNSLSGILEWSVDLEDREKVLRIECVDLTAETIIELLQNEGVSVEEMPVEYL